MDLEVLNLKVEAQAVERATRDLEDMGVALDKVDRAALKLNDTNKVLRGEQLRVAGSSVKVSDALTKTQAGFLATMKQAGASANEIKYFSKQFENMNKIMGLNTFDKSANALARMRKQTEELTKSAKYIERYNDLTKQQISLLTQGIEATRQRAISEKKSFGEREAAVKKFIKEFVKEAQSYNQVTAAIEEKNRVAREEIRIQQEAVRAAQVSAKQRADAEKYVQETLQKTLFINEQMEKGMNSSGASALYSYKQQLDLLGLSADQAAAKMEEFQTALTSRRGLRGATQEVSHLARAVGVQLGDVFVSLAGGMNPFLVMIQQGDQIRFALDQARASGQSLDNVMQGAFVNIANSFKMVGGIIKDFVVDAFSSAGDAVVNFSSEVVDTVGSLIGISDAMTKFSERLEQGAAAGNLFYVSLQKILTALKTLAGGLLLGIAVTIGSLVFAMLKLDSLQSDLAKSINLYGAGLGITTKQALEMAVASDKNTAAMVASISAIAKAGGFTKDQMKVISETAVEMQKTFGIAVADTVAKFVELRKDPVDALLELQVQTGNVSEKVIENVKELVKQGKTYKAVEDAMNEYARASSETSDQVRGDLGAQATAIIAIKDQWADFWKYFQSLANEAVLRVSTSMTLIGKVIGGTAAALMSLASGDKAGASNIMDMVRLDEAKLRLNLDLALGGDGSEQLVEFSNKLKEAQDDFEELRQKAANRSLFGPSGEDVADARLRVERMQQSYLDLAAVVTSSAEKSVTAEKSAASERARIEKDNADLIKSGISDYEEYKQRIGEIDEQISKARAAGVDDDTIAAMLRGRQKVVDDYSKSVESAGKEAEKTQKYFGKLMEGATDLALKTQQEVSKLNSGYDQMTDSQKMLFDAMNDRSKEGILLWDTLTERQKAEFENTLKLIEANEELIQQYKAQVALQEVLSKWVDDYDSAATSIKEEVDALKLRNDLLFKTEDEAKAIQRQYDLNVKLAAVENKYIERRNQMMMAYVDLVKEGNWSPEALVEYQRNMSAVNQQEAQERELVHKDANTQIVEDYEQKFKEIQGTVTDIIATALFEGGKSGSKKLKDVLKQSFRNYVIDVFINPIVGNIMGSITGGAGSSGQSSVGVTGLISNASSAYNLATGSTVAGISGAVQGAGAFLGSSAVSSFGAGMTMTGTQVAALSEAGLIASKGAASLGSAFGAAMPWIAGGLLVADLLGVFDKKPSDKSSWATVDPTTGMISNVGSMTGKKDPGQEQRDATAQLAAFVGQFAGMAGVEGELRLTMGQRDGIRLAMDDWRSPYKSPGYGDQYGKGGVVSYGSNPETSLVRMLDDLVDEGTLDQSIIDTWRNMKDEVDGTARASGELISVLNLLTKGYSEIEIERANLIQAEGESLDAAYARMSQYEKALAGTVLPGQALADLMGGLVGVFQDLGVSVPLTNEDFGNLISGIDTTTDAGKELYKTLMELVPGFLELSAAQESLYNQLLSEPEMLSLQVAELGRVFTQLGVSIPKTNDELRSLIDAQDASTEAGAILKAQLLSLVPAFVEVTTATQTAFDSIINSLKEQEKATNDLINSRIDSAEGDLRNAYQRQSQEISRVISKWEKFSDSLREFREQLVRGVSMSSGIKSAKNEWQKVLDLAKSGDEDALNDLVGVSNQYLDEAKLTSSTYQEYLKVLYNVANAVEETEYTAESEVVIAKRQLTILTDQVSALISINDSVMSVEQAIQNLIAARAEAGLSSKIPAVSGEDLPPGSITGIQGNAGTTTITRPKTGIDWLDALPGGLVLNSAVQSPELIGLTPEQRAMYFDREKQASSATTSRWTASGYATKNPEIVGYYNDNKEALATAGQGTSLYDYLSYHYNRWGIKEGRAFASGAAFTNGVVSRPTMFDASLMGEAGPEAIMPLTSIGGSLGVRAVMPDMQEVVEELQALRGETTMLRAEVRAVATNTNKSAKLLDRAMPDGQRILVTVD